MKISVFTPTYNRAYCLERLYDSLNAQTYSDFEWVVVDDGSTDNTPELIKSLQKKSKFPIIYMSTENGGKHRAINRGMHLVRGNLLLFMDSDDWLREDALEWIAKVDESIAPEMKKHYAGVQGLCVHSDGSLVGKTFKGKGYLDCTTIDRGKNGIEGDKAEVYYTSVIKQYPFPEIDGEKFLTERLVWDKIAHDGYLVRYFNEGIYFCEYLVDGLTYGGNCLYAKNPKQWAMAIQQDYEFGGTNLYNTTIQIYIYYLYEKNHISVKQICANLRVSMLTLYGSVLLQSGMDIARKIMHNGVTIRGTAEKDMTANQW